MKRLVLGFILIILIGGKTNSQTCCNVVLKTFGTISILPNNYTSSDTIKVVINFYTSDYSNHFGYISYLDTIYHQITISGCFMVFGLPSPSHHLDTIMLGILPEDIYTITINEFCSCDTNCTIIDTVTTSIPLNLITNIREIKDNNYFSNYPNPATDNLTIETPLHSTIEILTIQGQLIKTLSTTGTKTNIDHVGCSSYVVNVSSFPAGVYIVRVKTAKGIAVGKFVKE